MNIKMKIGKLCGVIVLMILITYSTDAQKNSLVVYEAPQAVLQSMHNDDFTVKVRKPGERWQDLFEYKVKVDRVIGTGHSVQEASLAYFDFEGNVEVSVTNNKGNIDTARVRPLSYGIHPVVSGNTLTFTLSEPANLSIEMNGDIFHNLHLFANPMMTNAPKPKDKNVLYFGPGVHEVPNNKLVVPSGKTVYLAGGAVLKGQIAIEGVSDVHVIGRGIVDQEVRLGVQIANSKNITVEGIFVSQCSTGGSDNVTIRNVKSISFFGWGDGMNVFASNNVLFDRVFCRNSDDCTTVYATRKGFTGGCKNITMKNSTLWADVAHPILIGTHGNTAKPDILEDLSYINIDILDHKEKQVDYQGAMSINVGDSNTARNVLFENIRVEDFREGQLVSLRVFFNAKYCTSPGLGIENVTFRNIEYNGKNANLSVIDGYDENRKVKNITFENLKINGIIIHDKMEGKPGWYKTSDMAGFYIGNHVEGISFKKT